MERIASSPTGVQSANGRIMEEVLSSSRHRRGEGQPAATLFIGT